MWVGVTATQKYTPMHRCPNSLEQVKLSDQVLKIMLKAKQKKSLPQSFRVHSFFFAHLFVLKWIILWFFFWGGQKLAVLDYCVLYSIYNGRNKQRETSFTLMLSLLHTFRLAHVCFKMEMFHTNWKGTKILWKKWKICIPHPFLETWRALRQNLFLSFKRKLRDVGVVRVLAPQESKFNCKTLVWKLFFSFLKKILEVQHKIDIHRVVGE